MASGIIGIVSFAAWTLFSFLAHYFARLSLQTSTSTDASDVWYSVLLVTSMQLLVGGICLKAFVPLATKYNWILHNNNDNNAKSSHNGKVQKIVNIEEIKPSMGALIISHLVATTCTNASMGFVNVGSAFTVKSFEPVSSAVLTSILIGKKLDTSCIVALPLVVFGAIGFIWKPGMDSFGIMGLSLAFVSNILFGIRNINLKQTQLSNQFVAEQFNILGTMSLMATIPLCAVIIVKTLIHPAIIRMIPSCILPGLTSGVFHLTYTIISTCIILKYTSVIGHATANLLKRVLVAIAFFILGQQLLSSMNIISAVIMVTGLLIYAFPNSIKIVGRCYDNPSLWLTVVIACLVTVAALLTPILPTHSTNEKSQNDEGEYNINKSVYPGESLSAEDLVYLNKDLVKYTNVSDYLSQRLVKTTSVISEATRIHDQVFPALVGIYKRAVLVNVFTWANKGDQLIMIGQRKILQRLGLQLVYYCYYPGNECDFSNIKGGNDLVVFIQGAGYIGHPAHLYVINLTVSAFPRNRIVVFPISTCHPTSPCTQIEDFSKTFADHPDLHVLLRDRYSYSLALKYFQKNKNYLVPDSAFAIGPIRINILPVYDIIWLKRDDWESAGKNMPPIPEGISFVITDWTDDWMKQDGKDFFEEHQLRAMAGMMFLSRGRVVITDRLHAHIMSVLLDKPNVIVNSNTRKQQHYFDTWEKSLENVYIVNDNHDALEKALMLLKKTE